MCVSLKAIKKLFLKFLNLIQLTDKNRALKIQKLLKPNQFRSGIRLSFRGLTGRV